MKKNNKRQGRKGSRRPSLQQLRRRVRRVNARIVRLQAIVERTEARIEKRKAARAAKRNVLPA